MIKEERYLRILDYLKANQTAKLEDLAELNKVSIDTVRRDLEQLDEKRMLKRVRGGAVFHKDDLTTQTFDMRTISQRDEKRELAQLVGTLVVDGQAIALNCGTTNIEVAKYLVENYYRLTILTNSLQIIEIMAKAKNFNVIVPGGIVDPKEGAIFGESCEQDILNYNIDTAILGVQAISIEKGITDFRMNQGGIIRAMIGASKQRVVVADHSKFKKVSYMNVCDLSEINYIISDSKFPKELYAPFEQRQIHIITP